MSEIGAEAMDLLVLVHAVLDKLASTDLTALPGDTLLEFTIAVETAALKVPTIRHAAIAELEGRHIAAEKKIGSTAALLVELLRLNPGEARRRVRDAVDFGPRPGLTGEPLEPLLPATAHALAAGDVSIEHARTVSRLFDRLPILTVEQSEELEAAVVDVARHVHPTAFAQFAVQVEARFNPDGKEPEYEAQRKRREFSLIERPDGSSKPVGEFTPMLTAVLKAVLGPLSAPDPAENGGSPANEGVAGGAGTRDQRSAGRRRHDGLQAACERLLKGGLPDSGGAATTLLVTIDYRDLLHRYWRNRACTHCHPTDSFAQGSTSSGGTGYGTTSYGRLIPVKDLLQKATDALIIPVVLDQTDGIMAYGRGKRRAAPEQRRALAARDRGCVRPGCTAPPDWCEAHHTDRWEHGGETNIDKLALACPHDHDRLEHGARIIMVNGIPHWLDPPWLDPSQTPRRNTANHPPIDFGQLPDPGPPGY
jgi:hypothetical protein